MGNFNGDNGRGGWRGDRGGSRGGRGEGRPEMHQATCVECGNECEVPFKPNGLKPIFCRDCFKKEEGPAQRQSYDRPSYDRPSNDRPSYDKPAKPAVTPHDQHKEQFEMLNVKLDYILKALSLLGATKIHADEKPAKELKVEKQPVKDPVKDAKPVKKAKKVK